MVSTKRAKFELKDLLPIGITFVVIGLGLTYGLDVLEDAHTDTCGYTSAGGKCVDCANGTFSVNTSLTDPNWCQNLSNSATQDPYILYSNADFNASMESVSATANFPEKLPQIALVIVAAVIIGILVRYLMVK